jgi:uncharacterized membrane protein (DUF4010 family)
VTIDSVDLLSLATAAAGGAAVGLERQWSGHADGPLEHFAGLRTFTLLGGLAGLAGLLWRLGYQPLSVVLLATAGAVVIVAYLAASRREVDATTEVAAVVVLAAGTLAGLGAPGLASGIFALTSLVLIEKSRLHAAVQRIDDVSLPAAVRFAVMSIVVLPLVPEGPIGWLGLRPRDVWILVLFLSGLSFAGYLARRLVGRDHGYVLTGLFGGIVSSTNITLVFSRLSRVDVPAAGALAAGTVAANAVLFPRVLLAASVLNPPLGWALWPWFAGPFLLGAGVLALSVRTASRAPVEDVPVRNPLQLWAALQMAVMFQAVMIVMDIVGRRFGEAGVLPVAAVLGAADVDALTISMATSVNTFAGADGAARAVAVGVLANTVVKCAIATVWGRGRYRAVAGGTLAAIAGLLVAELVFFP